MIKTTLAALLLFVPGIALSAPSASSSADNKPPMGKVIGGMETEFPPWFKDSFLDIAEDVQEATDEGKHLILYFHLHDCPYCHKMVEENFKHSPYTNFLQTRFDIIQINVRGDREVAFDEHTTLIEKDLARHLKVRYTPTILFLNRDNRAVLRLNGYRSAAAFKHALDFVHERAYEHTTLSRYIEENQARPLYVFREHESFASATDLHQAAQRPLALLFEDASCDECDTLHDGILKLPETKSILERFTVVRLDAFSAQPLTGIDGSTTTPKALAAELGLTYRPGLVLFDRGKEILRIDGMLRTFFFQEALRYVGERKYEQYPEFRDYSRARVREILSSGKDLDIWK